jgi:hypothetical protein
MGSGTSGSQEGIGREGTKRSRLKANRRTRRVADRTRREADPSDGTHRAAVDSTLVGVLMCEFVTSARLEQELRSGDLESLRTYFRECCGHGRSIQRPHHAIVRQPAVHCDGLTSWQAEASQVANAFDELAARASSCLDVAESGTLIASKEVLDQVPGLFLTGELQDVGPSHRAATVNRMVGVRSALDERSSRRQTPFVSRGVESDLLFDRWCRLEQREGRAILIRGEAGIGKSRLISSLRERLGKSRYSWVECQCAPESKGSAFRPLASFMEQVMGLNRSEPHSIQIQQLESALEFGSFPLDETLPLFATLIGIDLPAEYEAVPVGREELRRRTMSWLCEWVVRIGREQPTAIVFNDLHWSDPSTLEFVSQLIELIRSHQLAIVLILAAGNEFNPHWDGVEQIHAPRFTQHEIESMASAVTGERALPAILTHEVSKRSEGIPLFIEEFTRDVLEAESDVSEGPSTIETSMLCRVARVSDREVAHLISVVGHACPREVLESIASDW